MVDKDLNHLQKLNTKRTLLYTIGYLDNQKESKDFNEALNQFSQT